MTVSLRLLVPWTAHPRWLVPRLAVMLLFWSLCGAAGATERAARLGVPVRWQASETLLQIHEPPPESRRP